RDRLWSMALQVEVTAFGAPGRTLLLDSRKLLVSEVIRDRKLLSRETKRAGVGDDDCAYYMRSVRRSESAGYAGADVSAVGAVSGIAQSCHQFGEFGSCPAHF